MLRLALRSLRARTGSFVASFIVVFFGTMLVTACGILLETGVAGEPPVERYSAAPVVVVGGQNAPLAPQPGEEGDEEESVQLTERQRVDAGLADRIRAVPGVASVVPEVTFPAVATRDGKAVTGPDGTASLGHSWDSAVLGSFALREGRAPSGPGEVVIDDGLAARAGLQTGDRIDIGVRAQSEQYQVVGVAAGASQLRMQAAIFFAPSRAGQLAAHPGKVDALGVLAGPDVAAGDLAARVSEALKGTGVVVATGSQRSIAEVPRVLDAGERLIPLAASFGGMSLVLAVIMVAGTFGLSIQQQRREIALLRTIGATPRQVRRMLRRETLVVAILAALLGVVPGIWFSKVLYEQLRDFGLASRVIDVQVGQIPPIVAAVAGVVTALLGAMIAARRASQIRPIEALQEAEVERKPVSLIRLGAGVLFLAGSLVMSVLLSGFTGQAALESAIAIVLLSVLGLSCLSPALGWVAARLLGTVVRRVSDGPGYLAAASARTNIGRFAASLTPLMLAVGFASSMIFMQTTAVAAAEREGADKVVADHVISSSSGGLPAAVADEAGRVPGVREATGLVRTSVVLEQESVPALAVSGGFTSTLKIPMVSGDPDGVRGDGIALSADRAQRTGLQLGDRVAVRSGDAPAVDMKLVAIFQGGGSTGEALVPTGIVLGHTISGLLDEVLVSRADGADDSQLVAGLASLANRFPGVTITDKAAVYAYAVEQADKQSWINYLMAAAVLAYAAIASVNTIAMATARRTREFALLRLTGATRRQVMRMMRWESLMVAAAAIVLGTVMAAETLIPLSIALTGSPAPFTPALVCFAIIGGAALLALLAVEVPTRLALRRRRDLSY